MCTRNRWTTHLHTIVWLNGYFKNAERGSTLWTNEWYTQHRNSMFNLENENFRHFTCVCLSLPSNNDIKIIKDEKKKQNCYKRCSLTVCLYQKEKNYILCKKKKHTRQKYTEMSFKQVISEYIAENTITTTTSTSTYNHTL